MIRNRIWRRIALVVFLLTLGCVAYAGYRVVALQMLPDRYLILLGVGFAVLLGLCAFLLFKRGRRRNHLRQFRRIMAVVLSAAVAIVSLYAASMIGQLQTTIDSATNTNTDTGTKVGVYVLSGDAAQTVADITGDPAGIMETLGRTETDAALSKIEEQTGAQPPFTEAAGAADLADLLTNGDVRSIILPESYLQILDDMEGYTDFRSSIRLLSEYTVETAQDTTADTTAQDASTSDAFVIYLSGSDTRDSELPTSTRSDVNILLAVNPNTHEILLLNTPRDYYIPNPAGGGALDKLTHLGIYGVNNSIQGLSDLYEISIPYYAQINFTGFETLIDAIGGVDVNSPYEFTTDTDGGATHVVAGMNHFDGAQALAFARERHALAAGDNERGRNQMLVIDAVISKLTSGTTILTHYSSILDSLTGMFRTNLTSDDINTLVKNQLDTGASWHVSRYAVSGYNDNQPSYSLPSPNYVMQPNWDSVAQAKEYLNEVLAGQTPSIE